MHFLRLLALLASYAQGSYYLKVTTSFVILGAFLVHERNKINITRGVKKLT
jgi:hypothetical protein